MTSVRAPSPPTQPIVTAMPVDAPQPRATRVIKPAMPQREPAQTTSGCFADAFNGMFIAVMTKLFGRDGRG